MNLIDWAIVLIPLSFVMWIGFYSRRYIHGVADYLAAGRLCGRYVITMGDLANALAIITLVAYVEVHYKTGFALGFWQQILVPIGILMSLGGFCIYRFRETKSMSLGQFLEMRYSRNFRIFAALLRSVSEVSANMIMPAIAGRFFIYYLDLPSHLNIFGFSISVFILLMLIMLTLAISLIWFGGTLTLVITDAIQGLIAYPLMLIFIVFIVYKFSWGDEIVPVMFDRVQGESFLNPYEISNLRDFNLFFLFVTGISIFMHRASWIGAGYSTAARSPHEQKMAGLLGTWRGALNSMLYLLIAVAVLTLLSHQRFSGDAKNLRTEISTRVAGELVENGSARSELIDAISAIPPQSHEIGSDCPLSEKSNMDTPYLDAAHNTLLKYENGNSIFQEFRTLYHQTMMAVSMRNLLPTGLLGAFCLLMILAMISTDDTRIFSAAITITQDVILPMKKRALSPHNHIKLIRLVSIGVGIIFLAGSYFMAQLDYINLFIAMACSMWLGGCGPVMIFGLYSRFGTTAGAWASLLSGMILSLAGMLIQRNWADLIYPLLDRLGLTGRLDGFLSSVSSPFNPYIVWEMNPVKFPINSYEIYFMVMLVSLLLYCAVSWLTLKEPFNMDRMLHRGKYNIDNEMKDKITWSLKNFLVKTLGISNEYSRSDRFITWAVFLYSFGYSFCLSFLGVVIWNAISPWPLEWWGHYFLLTSLVVPGILAAIVGIWFGIGGIRDILRLFRDLDVRTVNHLDNGQIDGHVLLSEKEIINSVEQKAVQADNKKEEIL